MRFPVQIETVPTSRDNAVIDAPTVEIFDLSIFRFKSVWGNVPRGPCDFVPRGSVPLKSYVDSPIKADNFNSVGAGDGKQSFPVRGIVRMAWLLIELNVQQ